MGQFFSDAVEQALHCIYYGMGSGRGQEGFQLLTEASNSGDGDASYFLSRCLSGPSYVWSGHGFPEDDDAVAALIRKAISQGSAVGVLGAMRCGQLTPGVKKEMPFTSLKEAWEIVHEKAKGGEPFCMYMIGNTHFWGDVLAIENRPRSSFANEAAFRAYLKEQFLPCIHWFERAFDKGVSAAGGNLYNIYTKGEPGILEPQPEKAQPLTKRGAELGYPPYQLDYANSLKEAGKEKEALEWYRKAAERGEAEAWYYVGRAYEDGNLVTQNLGQALACYEKGLAGSRSLGCLNRAGSLYYRGEGGVAQDYARAVQYLEEAFRRDNNWGADMLASCYLFGWGCRKDPVRARQVIEKANWSSPLMNYCHGLIYADGLGVAEDIKKGVEYLQKAGDYPPAREALLRFKKSIFGKWSRR